MESALEKEIYNKRLSMGWCLGPELWLALFGVARISHHLFVSLPNEVDYCLAQLGLPADGNADLKEAAGVGGF